MPDLSTLMSSGRNYPTGQAPAPSTAMDPVAQPPGQPPDQPPAIDPSAFGQTLAAFLAQSGMADTLDVSGIAKGSTPGQFTLPWGAETLHLLSTTGPAKQSPGPEALVIVPQQTYEQFAKTRSVPKRQALIDSIVQGTQTAPATVMGGAA